ncbi:MAG: metallophosphoesterase [Patescibacteria group bacterium]
MHPHKRISLLLCILFSFLAISAVITWWARTHEVALEFSESEASTASLTPTFTWTTIQGAAKYDFWISKKETPNNPYYRNQEITTTSFTIPSDFLEPNTTYTWWVRNAAGGAWSKGIDFTTASVVRPDHYTIVVLPDTQHYVDDAGRAGIFTKQTQWIRDTKAKENIAFVFHVGDIVENGTNTIEWSRAKKSMGLLDGIVPYAFSLAAHDWGISPVNDSLYNKNFPASVFPNLSGVYDKEPTKTNNTYHTFQVGGTQWLVLALQEHPTDDMLRWGNEVITSHPNHKTIVLNHSYLLASGKRSLEGENIWNKLVRKHKNIAFTIHGHEWDWSYLASTGDNGNRIHQIMANFQGLYQCGYSTNYVGGTSCPFNGASVDGDKGGGYVPPSEYPHSFEGGSGYLRIMRFYPATGTATVRTFSPHLDAYVADSGNVKNALRNHFDISGLSLSTSQPSPTPTNGNQAPIGWLDSVDNGEARGWALDPNDTSSPINVHFYIDGPAGTGTLAAGVTANQFRSDVGNHGFMWKIPTIYRDGKSHTLYVYGIDAQGGTNPSLSGVPKTFLIQKGNRK